MAGERPEGGGAPGGGRPSREAWVGPIGKGGGGCSPERGAASGAVGGRATGRLAARWAASLGPRPLRSVPLRGRAAAQHRGEAGRLVLRLRCGLGRGRRRGARVDEERGALAQAHAPAHGQDRRRVRRQPVPLAAAEGVDVRAHGGLEVDHVHAAAAVGGGRAVHDGGVLARDRVVRHHQVRLLPVPPHHVRGLAREVELLHRLLSAHQPHAHRLGGHDRPSRRLPPVRAWRGRRAQALDDVLHRQIAQRERIPFREQPRLHRLDRFAAHSHALGGLQVEEIHGGAAVDQRRVLPRDRIVLHEDM